MKNNKKVIGLYTRVLTGQKEQIGLGMQQREGIRSANKLFGQDIEIKFYVDEGFGAKSNNGRNQMLEDVKEGRLDAIITYKIGSISRSITHALKLVKEIHKSNARFFSIIEGEYTPLQLSLEFKILEAVAQYERDSHAERIRKGIASKKTIK